MLSPADLLDTAERLFEAGDGNQSMYRAAVLEAVTALEAAVQNLAFVALENKVGKDLADWMEEKTRMDFDTRLGLFVPIATGLKVDKKDRLWSEYKKAKDIRNKVTHAGRRVSRTQARNVIDAVYGWIEYLNQARGTSSASTDTLGTSADILGRFVQASARLERVIYNAVRRSDPGRESSRQRVLQIDELWRLGLVDESTFRELAELRSLRNRAVHGMLEDISISDQQVARFNQIVDAVEAKLNQS